MAEPGRRRGDAALAALPAGTDGAHASDGIDAQRARVPAPPLDVLLGDADPAFARRLEGALTRAGYHVAVVQTLGDWLLGLALSTPLIGVLDARLLPRHPSEARLMLSDLRANEQTRSLALVGVWPAGVTVEPLFDVDVGRPEARTELVTLLRFGLESKTPDP